MTDEAREHIGFIVSLLKSALEEHNAYIGVLVNKQDENKSDLVFLDRTAYENGTREGMRVSLQKLNEFGDE